MAFKTIQKMRFHRDKEASIREKESEHLKLMGATTLSNKESEAGNTSGVNASATKNSFGVTQDAKANKTVVELEKEKTPFELEMEALGRYWIWENYCDDEYKNKHFEEGVEMLRHINPAVHQDIQDSIIRDGMLPRKERQNEELKSAADTLKHMKTYDNSMKAENMQRPPELWNYQKVIEEEHKFRSIADPKKSYIDGRIERLDELIINIGEHLRKHDQREWNELMRRVIDYFKNEPDDNPFSKVAEEEGKE